MTKYSAYPIKESVNREQTVYYTLPDKMDGQTGILLLISGFCGSPEANVYKKMRSLFADQYNLVVVNPTYLGMEFMDTCNQITIDDMQIHKLQQELPIAIKKQVFANGIFDLNTLFSLNLPFKIYMQIMADLNETDDNFLEMGAVQAIDCMRALKAVYDIITKDGVPINPNRIIAYGHSHGAYLVHLCNRFFPHVFLLILDNSAWISPTYLKSPRFITFKINSVNLEQVFDYRIASQNYDQELYSLEFLYNGFNNNANIIIYQGVTDTLIDHDAKSAIFDSVEHVTQISLNYFTKWRENILIYSQLKKGRTY